jgi:hypothetical protein
MYTLIWLIRPKHILYAYDEEMKKSEYQLKLYLEVRSKAKIHILPFDSACLYIALLTASKSPPKRKNMSLVSFYGRSVKDIMVGI